MPKKPPTIDTSKLNQIDTYTECDMTNTYLFHIIKVCTNTITEGRK